VAVLVQGGSHHSDSLLSDGLWGDVRRDELVERRDCLFWDLIHGALLADVSRMKRYKKKVMFYYKRREDLPRDRRASNLGVYYFFFDSVFKKKISTRKSRVGGVTLCIYNEDAAW
jgi:hypothetical protein